MGSGDWLCSIYQYSSIVLRLSGPKLLLLFAFRLSISKRDLDSKNATPNIEVCPENLRAMLAYISNVAH